MERNISYQMLYLIAATSVVRFKYYHAWVLADAICNLSGLGFNGYTENGTPKWDLVSNVDILGFEVFFFFKPKFNEYFITHTPRLLFNRH